MGNLRKSAWRWEKERQGLQFRIAKPQRGPGKRIPPGMAKVCSPRFKNEGWTAGLRGDKTLTEDVQAWSVTPARTCPVGALWSGLPVRCLPDAEGVSFITEPFFHPH